MEGEKEDLQVTQASTWWEWCRFSNEASEKVILYVKQKRPLLKQCELAGVGKVSLTGH